MHASTRRTKQEIVSEFRCKEILDAARKLFAKKGFADATMDEIAAACGLAKGTLYLYFKSKRDVYLRTLQHGAAELLERVTANMHRVTGARAKLRANIATRLEYAEDNRDFIKIYLTEFINATHPASINKDFRDVQLKLVQGLEQVLQDAVEHGEIQQVDVETIAFTIQDMIRSLTTRRVLGALKKHRAEDIDILCYFIWKGIGWVDKRR
jgi:TetR/AcrR family transcriptional regulator, fatty acid metabolism regulator protein